MPTRMEAIRQHVAATFGAMGAATGYATDPVVTGRGAIKATATDPDGGLVWTPTDRSLVLAILELTRLDEESSAAQVVGQLPARWRMTMGAVYHARASHDDAADETDLVLAASTELVHALQREPKRGGLAKDTQPVRAELYYEPGRVELEFTVDFSSLHGDLMADVAVPAVSWAA